MYLRLQKDQRLEDVSPATIMECAQLVKANSIEGCKLKEVYVGAINMSLYFLRILFLLVAPNIASISILVYTRWRNLLKTASMEVGQVGFHDKTKVKRMKVEKDNSIVNRLNKTKEVCTLKR